MSDDYEEDVGFHFAPTDEELINNYLIPKLTGEPYGGDLIVMMDVYAKEPSLLDHTDNPIFLEDEYYYFTIRKQNSKGKINGSWKQNYKKNIIKKATRKIIGTIENLTYMPSNKKKQERGDGGASATTVPGSERIWFMNQYTLPDDGTFQELVLCKIYTKDDDDLHESSASSEQQPININSEGANESEIPHVAYPCSSAETERNREQNGEANMISQILDDLLSACCNDLTMNGSGLAVEESGNTPSTGQNLLHEASTSTHHHESSSSEQQQIKVCNKIQEKNKSTKKKDDHHKAHIPHHYESSYSEINETHLHYPETPRILSMSNSDAETERNEKHNGEENMVHQIHAFSSIKLDDAYEKDEELEATNMAMTRDEADVPNLKSMDS